MLTIPGHKGNANQNQLRFHFTSLLVWLLSTTPTTNAGEDAGKKYPYTLLVGK
jgi:hypothetical protein